MATSLSEGEQLQAALEGLRRCRPLPSSALSKLVVTGSGFWGPARLAIREFAALAGFTYSGDLVRGPGAAATTHLVLLCSETAAAAGTSAGPASKRQKAAEWGVPIVSLGWLLNSIAAGQVQPVELYQVSASQPRGRGAGSAAGPAQQSSESMAAPSCQQLPLCPRPSSVGSPVLSAAGVPTVVAHRADAADAHGGSSRERQQAQQEQSLDQPAHDPRQPLAPANANVLLDQLRRMSISPEPPLGLVAAAGASCCPQQQRQQLGQAADSPPLHRSPSLQGSPQRSLSLQGLLMQGSQQGTPAESASRDHVAAVAAERRQSWAQQSAPRPQRRSAPSPGAAFSPMQQSPAAAPAHLASRQHHRQQLGMPQQPPNGTDGAGAPLFDMGPACLPDDLPGGSPMAESPAAASMHSAGRPGSAAFLQRHSRLAGTPASSQGSQDPMCTLPTPACIRDWSEDDSPMQGSAAPRGSPPGITQTPPDVRQALAAAGAPTQWPASAGQQQQQQQLFSQPVQHESKQQQQQQSSQVQHSASVAGDERMPLSTPGAAAVRDWSDDETVASDDGLQAHDIIVPDSEPMGDDLMLQTHDGQQAPSSMQQQWQRDGQREKQEQQPADIAALQPTSSVRQQHQQEQQQEERQPSEGPQQQPRQKRGLLQVSRTGQQPPRTAARVPAVSMSKPSAAAAAVTQVVQPAASAASPSNGGAHDALDSPGFACEAAHPASSYRSGSGSALPGASPGSINEHDTSSRQAGRGAGAGRPLLQKQQKSVREWSEDSSGDEFPTPTGQQRQRAGGLTGLTQLDAIVIARPRPAGSTATWRSGEAGGASSGGVVGIKFLQRPPRGNAVRTHHGVATLKNVQFAEQVAAAGGLVLSTKDKKTAVRLQPGGLTEEEAEDDDFQAASTSGRRSSQGSQGSMARRGGSSSGKAGVSLAAAQGEEEEEAEAPVLAEPQTFYRLPDGSWWLEYCRFFTAAQAEQAAAKAGRSMALPPDFDRTCELLKAVGREHGPMGDIAGGVQVRRVKQGSTALRLRGGTAAAASGSRSYFWRLAVDTDSWRVLTDRPPADFVAVE